MRRNNNSRLGYRLTTLALTGLTIAAVSESLFAQNAQAQFQLTPQLEAQPPSLSDMSVADLLQPVSFDPTQVIEPTIDLWEIDLSEMTPEIPVPENDPRVPEDVCPIEVCESIGAEEVQRFLIRFNDGVLRYEPGDDSLQISTQRNVLSYGQDWQVLLMEPGIYALKQDVWKGFFWKVNTVTKKAYRVTNGSFPEPSGDEELLSMTVETVGSDQNPDWFYLRFDESYLVRSKEGVLQIATEGNVLSYGSDWSVVELSPYLFQLRQDYWQKFYWEVNTSDSVAYRVKDGIFGQDDSGSWEDLDVVVDVVY